MLSFISRQIGRTNKFRQMMPIFAVMLSSLLAHNTAIAQLYSLAFDRNTQQTQLYSVNTSDASFTSIGAGTGLAQWAYNAVANDPFNQLVYALGIDPIAADGSYQLVRFDSSTGTSQIIGNIGTLETVVSLHFERSSMRLIAALNTGSIIRLVSIDPLTAAINEIHTGISDCCILNPSVSALNNGRLFFSGRLRTDLPDTVRLIGFSTSGDNNVTMPLTSARLAALVENPATGLLYGLNQISSAPPISNNLQLVQVASDGTTTDIGAALTNCCSLALDVATISSNVFIAAGRNIGSPDLSLINFDLMSGSASFSSAPIDNAIIVNAFYDQLKGLIPTTTSIDNINPNPVEIGQSYTVNATVTAASGAATGTVTIDDGLGNSCQFTAPSGQCSLTATMVGSATITANYNATGNFTDSSAINSVQITQATSTTNIISISPNPAVVGNLYTVTVSVNGFGTATGTVMVSDGLGMTCQINLPATSCDLNSINAGARVISANYSGDVNNLPSSTSTNFTVNPAVSNTQITLINPSPSTVGMPYTVTATVSGFGTPSGSIQVNDGDGASCTIVLPATACALTSTSAGLKTITASYLGDANNLPSNTSMMHTVDRAMSTTNIQSINPTPSTAGQLYTVTVQVTGFGTVSGNIDVSDGLGQSCIIVLPATECSLTTFSAGAVTVNASYVGDINNLPSSDNFAHSVVQAATSLSLSATPNPVLLGFDTQLIATVHDGVDPITGTVSFTINGNVINACGAVPVINNSAECITQFDQPIALLIGASYSGDMNNISATSTLGILVQPLPIPTMNQYALYFLLLALFTVGLIHLRKHPVSS